MKTDMKCRIVSGGRVSDIVNHLNGCPAIYIVADRNVASFAENVAAALTDRKAAGMQGTFGGLHGNVLYIDATEERKSMDSVLEICKWLMDSGADRNALVLAIGGGITTDMAGFAASIYKRGVRFAYIPTTLLAQVDAAIGGKTGVNFGNYKNILGVIRQPEFTYICPEVLGTLPYRDFLSGAAELLKTFIIDDSGANYEKAVEVLSEIHASAGRHRAISAHLTELEALISAAGRIKAGVVERDEFERGERRKLNLGHTFAHAIEWESRSMQVAPGCCHDVGAESSAPGGISHGEAVAMGMILAARLSQNYYHENRSDGSGTASDTPSRQHGKSLMDRLENDFRSCGLPVECPFPLESLSGAMQKDKKAEDGIVHFVLIHGIGDVRIEDLTVEEAIRMLHGRATI